MGTSAWNALLRGHKRWALFPPHTPKHIIDPPMKPYDHEAVSWFSTVFPKFQVRDDPNDTRTLGERLGMIQVLQRPGETIFVPGGWAHVVMNLGKWLHAFVLYITKHLFIRYDHCSDSKLLFSHQCRIRLSQHTS